jgi:putative transposase
MRHDSKRFATLVQGQFPETYYPQQMWQIDHTPVDIIVVDEIYRKPIGRPYLTIAIDMYSRCIPGFCLTLEAPSSVSVGLCMTHAVLSKEEWLAQRDIKTSWPIWGKPEWIHVDNAHEFHSEALKRGCDAHGIEIAYRPKGQPHYGGTVERVIGTFMKLVHSLPGTTFSNIQEKGNYPSDKKAVLTLTELEYWFTIAITDYYHQKLHSGIQMPPIEKYKASILGDKNNSGRGYPAKIHNRQAFFIDFLPIEYRTIQRHGFMLDHISYNCSSLSPLIANKEKYQYFLIRRDPRDLSYIYVLEPHSNRYLQVPYRTLSRPSITLWEHKRALSLLSDKGISKVDESLIFQAIEKMREAIKAASKKTKSARRQQAKTDAHLKNKYVKKTKATTQKQSKQTEENDTIVTDVSKIKPFDDIETW